MGAPELTGAGNRAQAERIYGMRELTRILTLTPRRTAQLRRLLLLHGDSGYTFRDLLALRAAGALLDAGAACVIQPGGSMRDAEVIAAADERGIAMVFTGVRHFRH